jgi:ribosomal-protein-serine acetyltransferase
MIGSTESGAVVDERAACRLLRPLETSDAPELCALIETNRERLAVWMPWAGGQTLSDTKEFIRRASDQLADDNGFQAAIIEDGQIVGVAGFRSVDRPNRSTSIGYWLSESAQGRGIATETVRGLVDHAIVTWRLNRVEIRAGVGNRRSRAIPERLGFTFEGVLREAERVGERYVDQAVYAVLARDWLLQR